MAQAAGSRTSRGARRTRRRRGRAAAQRWARGGETEVESVSRSRWPLRSRANTGGTSMSLALDAAGRQRAAARARVGMGGQHELAAVAPRRAAVDLSQRAEQGAGGQRVGAAVGPDVLERRDELAVARRGLHLDARRSTGPASVVSRRERLRRVGEGASRRGRVVLRARVHRLPGPGREIAAEAGAPLVGVAVARAGGGRPREPVRRARSTAVTTARRRRGTASSRACARSG